MTDRVTPREVPSEPFARWPWQRCSAVWSRNGISRRCDLRYAHHGIPHFSEHGLDPLRWWEGTVMPNTVALMQQFWLQGPVPADDLSDEEVALSDGEAQVKWLAEQGYAVIYVGAPVSVPSQEEET